MKKIIIYGILIGTCFLTACSEEFLEKNPPLNFTEAEAYANITTIDGNVNSLYAALKSQYTLGGKVFVIVDNIGDDFINVSGNGYELAFTYDGGVTTDRQENYEFWTYTYLAINRCNVFLKNLETYKENAGSKYNQYVAEAKFVRALAYYYLHQIYTMPYVIDPNAKSVVLRLEAELDLTRNDLARSLSGVVLDQILDDLSSSDALPKVGSVASEATVARATQGAAEALKMRIYMIKGEWQKAIEAGEKITGYSLADEILTVFRPPYITSENIFSLPFASTNRAGQQYATGYYYISGRSNEIDLEGGILGVSGYNNTKDDRISKLTNIDADDNKIKGRFLLKYTDATYADWLPVFRYSEILLNLAESYFNLNPANEQKAIELVKQVRERSLAPADDNLQLDNLTGNALKEAIYNERRLELLGEGVRGLDIFRRGETIVKQKGTIYEAGHTFKPADGVNGYIWPIPQVERAQNRAIED